MFWIFEALSQQMHYFDNYQLRSLANKFTSSYSILIKGVAKGASLHMDKPITIVVVHW
jgi:hypothetical protein